ncbi:MAG: TonB-dependent receptor [Gammaproteobacteria bacterium]|nr:MAG: TonB-dependent receptor [Gammaproteobacteria bacterium]
MQTNHLLRSIRAKRIVLVLAACASVTSNAAVLEEIVVTAQKREQDLQDVGISISAFSGPQLRELGYIDAAAVTAQTPGVSVFRATSAFTQVNIRGVSQNDFADHLEAPIALYVDEAYVASTVTLNALMYDTERVEVLRGPQGTLFGRNATGGLIHIVSRKPTVKPEGFLQLEYGEHNRTYLEGAAGGPLSDSVLGRFSLAMLRHNPLVHNRIGKDMADMDQWAARAQLLFQPSESTEIHLIAHGGKSDETPRPISHVTVVPNELGLGRPIGPEEVAVWPNIVFGGAITAPCAGCDLNGYREPDADETTVSVDEPGSFEREFYGLTGKVALDLAPLRLVSISNFLTVDKSYLTDPDASPNPFFHYGANMDMTQLSQELRLENEADQLRWVAGLYYLSMDGDYDAFVDFDVTPYLNSGLGLNLPPGSAVGHNGAAWSLEVTSLAAFGQLEYDLGPSWTLTAGLRYTEDEKTQNYLYQDAAGPPVDFSVATYPDLARQRFRNFSAKAAANWRPTADWLVYGSWTRGHKGGNFAAPVFGVPGDPVYRANVFPTVLPHDEEVLTAYELGAKGAVFGGRARLNGAVFYYDYKDYQVFSLQNSAQALFNRDATVSGGEVELTITPTDRLEFRLGVAALWEKTIRDVPIPVGSVDRVMPMAPDLTVSGVGRYEWPALGGRMAVQADFKWTDDFYFYALNEPITREPSYIVTNVRLSYTTADDKWQTALWVRNLGDTDYMSYRVDVGALGFCTCAAGEERWIGATVTYRWE